MVSNGLSDLLSNENTGQGDFPGNGLARLLDDPAKPKAQDPTAPPAGGAAAGASVSMPPSASVADFVKNAMPAAQRVAKRLNVPVEAVIGQWGLETGWGKSVIPGTNNLGNIKDFRGGGVSAKDNANGKVDKYRQYASVDEFADDFANLLANSNYKAVPGTKDAQSYFAALKAARYAEDPDYVAKGASAAKMVADAIGKGAGAQAGAPDLAKAPKWGDITSKAEFKALSDAEKAEAKKAYFDYWIAPQAGDQADSLREQFMAKSDTPGLGQRLSEGLDGLNERAASAIKGMFKSEPALLERPNADVPKNEAASMAPVRPEVRAKFNTAWDSATPQQREAMAAQPGWVGMLARERAGIYGQPGEQLTKTGQQFDPRVESRREALIAGGEDARAAATFARLGAARGIQPGLETAKLGTIEASEFDFDTKQAFGGDQANGLNNVLARGLTKGGLGFGKAITGYGEFLSDVYGLDETGKTMREGNKWARGKEEAIGQRGDRGERNLEGAIASIAQQLPLMIGGIKAGSEAIPLAGMAMQAFGQEYTDGRAMGQSIEQAATRAAVFAAFEVIGEKFGLKANMSGVKALAAGKPADEVMRLFASAMARDVPGELLTTTGQFGTDKFAPGGVGLNPQGTLEQYASAMVDTFIQTLMQGGIMGGAGYIRPTWNALKGGQQTNGQIEAGAITARDRALGAWETNGLSAGAQPGAQATPRAEPTMAPHQTVQDADQIVRELAEQAGVPLETVLPQSVVAPVTVAPAPVPAETPAQAQGQDEITDADVMAFAEARYRTLRDKAEGGVSLVPGDEGMVEQQTPGVALSEVEQRELDALNQMGNDPAAVRTLYGFDGQRTEVADAAPAESEADREARLEREAIQAEPPATGTTQQDDDIPGFDVPAQDAGTATEGAGASQPAQVQPKTRAGAGHAKSVANYKVDTEDSGSFGVRVNRLNDGGVLLISNDGSPVIEHNAAFSDGKTDEELIRYSFEPLGVRGLSKTEAEAPKPKTEKEARAQKDYGDKWFGSADKAQAFIAKQGIGESHEVAQDGKKFTIKKKGTPNGTQATQAQQAGAQQQEAGDQGSDAQAGAGAQGPGVPATGRTDVQADGLKGAAPGTRMNGEAERAAADRLEKLIEQIPPNALPRAAGAKMILRSVVEQLRKPRTAISVEDMLETAIDRLYADKYVPQSEVVIDVLDAIDRRNGQQDELDAEMRGYEDKASGKTERDGIKLTPAQKREIEAGGTGFVGELGESARSSLQAMRNNPKVPVIKTDATGSYFNDELPQYTDIGSGFSVRGYSVRGDVVQDIKLPNGMVIQRKLKADGSVTGSAEGNYDQIVEGKGFAEAEKLVADYFAGRQAAAQTQALPAPKVEAADAPKSGYTLPDGDINDEWRDAKGRGTQHPDFEPTARQQILMDAVGKVLDAGAFYSDDVKAKSAEMLGVGKDVLASNRTGVQGGDFGYDVYLASRALETKRATKNSEKIARELNLSVGDSIGTLMFLDFKVTTGVTITSKNDTGLIYGITGKRGAAVLNGEVGVDNLKGAIERAHERGKRKDSYADFIASRKAQPTPAAADDFDAMFDDVLAEELAKDEAKKTAKPASTLPKAGTILFDQYGTDYRVEGETIGFVRLTKNPHKLSEQAMQMDASSFNRLVQEDAQFRADIIEQNTKPKTEKEAKAKRAEAAVREMTEDGRAKDGKPINGGDVFRTLSGRTTTPYPKQKGERYASDWLIENAKAEAQARGDDFNTTGFGAVTKLKGGNLTPADRDSMLMYLFGEQPAVVPSILKPLASAGKNSAAALANAIDGLGALFGGAGKLSSGFTFDEDTYAKAKPLFKEAVANLGEAGKDLREAMRAVVRLVLDKFGAQAAQNMKPYVVRFIEESSIANVDGGIEEDTAWPSDIQTGDKLDVEAYRARKFGSDDSQGSKYGTFYAETEDGTSGYGGSATEVIKVRIKADNVLVAQSKRDALQQLFGKNSDEEGRWADALDNPDEDSERVADEMIGPEAIAQGFDAVVYPNDTDLHGVQTRSIHYLGNIKSKPRSEKEAKEKKKEQITANDLHTPEGKFKVAQQLADHLIGGGAFDTIVAARKMIGDIIGRKIEPATELAKQADETVEVAVVLAAREMIAAGRKQGRSPQVIYDRLLSLFKAQPNLAVRSSTSMRDQAYSTPVPLAYVASQLAGVTADTKMIESTAGNGMLAIGASLANATVNELNPKRAAMLEAMGFKPTTENAATANLAPARSQDAVVINPPFGATKDSQGNTIVYEVKPDYGTREVDHAIVFKTLEAMKDDGRAVLIVGGVMSEADEARREDYRGKNKRMFYFNLYRDYNVVDHFTVDGALYAKQGASYPVDVIVINGRGKSSRDLPAAALPHIIRSYEELKEKLNAESSLGAQGADGSDVADSGTRGAGNPDDTQNVAGRPGASGGRVGTQGEKPSAGGAAGVRGAGSGRVNGQPQPGGAVPPAEQLEPQGVVGVVGDRQGAVRGEGAGKRGSTGSTGNERLPALGGPGIVSGERVQSGLTDRRGEEQETETQVAYTPQSGATSVGTLVPRAMKDAIEGSLQRIADEVGDLDQYVADSLAMDPETLRENFSAEQVDALALAIRNAEAGKGFIIGDQTGIGKGRVVAAMIRYALINDKTPVFVTEKPNLYSDMIRDLDDIGMTDDLGLDTENPRIFITNSDETIPYTLLRTEGDEVVENNLNLRPAKRGAALNDLMQSMMEGESLGDYKVIFTTYSQMQTVKGAETTRQKFVKQFGASNYMIFDESHNAGGAGETQARTKEQRKAEKAGQSLVTGRAAFVRELVTSAYGTFFSSATYAKRPDVMDLYSSTNMRLAVDKIADLGAAIKEGGVPMQQVVANMLTQDGQYIRRERTFAGVSYDTVPTTVDKQTAENMASAMRSILNFSRRKDALLAQMQKEADKEGSMLQAVGSAKTSIEGANFGAIMHNLIDQMLLSLKVEYSVKHAIERLKAGEKVVMTVSNTMGSFLKEYADEMGLNNGDVVGLSFGDLYLRYLEKQRNIKIKRPGGQVEEKRLSDAELGPELTQLFNDIQTQIRSAGFGSAPISPIDYMHTELRKAGFATDEITGRTMVLNYVDGTPTLASRTANIKQRVNAVRGFNNGTIDALILNQAGSTGLSLHAAAKFKDQRKRHMIIVQAEKNIDTHMQMLGRVHRTGQVVTPSYSQMMADIPAEMRPAAVLLKKMASLNANTTASRKSAVTAEGVVDFMNYYGGQVVHEFLRDNTDVHSALGGSKVLKLLDDVEEATEDDIRKLTGYIPILPIAEQERIYADLIQRYNELIERENSLGTNKLEAKALDLDAETIKVQPLTEQKQDLSIFAAPANMELVDVKRTVKPFSSEEVKAAAKERLGTKTGVMIASEMITSLRERGQAFIDERMKKAEASDKADPVRLADQRMLLQMTLNRVATVLDTFSIGDQVSVADKNTGTLYGVITDIAPGGRTANPAAGSDWKMTIALANGDSKSITINFSQIGNRYQIKGERTVNWYNAETQQSEEMRVIDIFDKGVRVRREKRWIVTGNILAGFSKFQGQIITYTKKDGTVAQGVLMSRQFDFDKEVRGMKVGMRNVAAAMEFFKTAGMNSTIGTEDGNFKIMATRSQFSAMTPSAKRIGGSYYLDPTLTEAIGADFYKKGTNMVATVPDYRIAEVLDYLINTRGETLVALTHNDVARKLAGLDKPGEPPKAEGVKFSATDSAEGYTGQDEKAQVHPQKTERSARNIRQLQRGVVAYLRDDGQTVDDRVQPYIGVDVRAAQEIRAISQVFGIEVQWFALAEGLTPEQKRQFGGFDGANLGGVQYLNAKKSDRPHLAVLGHELAHQMRKDSPDLYAEFVDSVNRYIKPGEYKKFLTLAVARDAKDPREEFSGEVLSDLFMERNFWISLGERSPGLLAKVADMVTRLVEQLMQAVGYTKRSAPYVSDFNKVMEIAADVMTRYAGQKMKAAGEGEISFSRTDDKDSAPNIVRRVQNNMIQFFGNSQKDTGLNTFNAYDKTVGSQYNKALKDKHFGRVYQLLLGMQNHVSMAAMRAAQLAPGIMPAVDDIKGAAKALFSKRKQGSLDNATRAVFLGTLAGATVMDGKVWSKAEFMGRFNDETAWALYQQTRAAIDASLDEVASAEAYNMASKFLAKDMRAQVIAQPGGAEGLILGQLEKQLAMTRLAIVQSEVTGDEQQANEMAAARDSIKATIHQVERIFVTAKNLKLAGYAPLMRFGKYTVEAKAIDPMTGNVERDENGKQITHFFGRYESEKEARKVEAALRNEYEGDDAVAITAGTYNSDRHELYTGVTPETLELFAEATGMGDMADEFIRLAKSDRSAMKRQLERKGTPGFSQDLPRVMSSFITSNARHAAQRLYMTSINQAVKRIPKEKGDVQQEAQKLRNFVLNPDDAGAVSSSLMFAWFLGGSVAAAAVNMTQPLMVTLPFLTQFTTVAKASALLTKAMPAAFGKAEITDKELREGLERASLEGVVDAQEIFHLYSMGSNQLVKGNRGQAALTLWGAMFSGVEKINRRMTFIAAWNLAKERGEKNPYAFAVRAVNQTQGIYNKVNRPNIARTWGGRMVMTYKGYSLMIGELMVRMWKSGPQGKKAVMIMLAMLFLASGEEGLPMSKALDDLIDTIGQLLGFDTNMRRWKRRTAHEIMGKEWGDAFLYGASAWLPLDFGGRLGLGQMLPGTEILKPSSGIFNMRAIGELVGPTAGAGGQIGDAAEASFEGNYGKAVQNASPKAVRDLLAGLEMATRGQATDARGRKVEDVGLTEAGVKAIGFQPTKVAMAHRRTMPIQQDIALQGKREAAIVAKWARAAMDGDQKGVEAAIAERDAWNERNPDTPIVISKQQILGRVKTMRAEKDTRMFKTAPKEMRGRVGLDLLDE